MNRFLNFILIVLTVVFASLYIKTNSELKDCQARLENHKDFTIGLNQALCGLSNKVSQLNYEKEELQSSIKMSAETPESLVENIEVMEEEPVEDKSLAENMSENLSKMMEKPEMQDLMRTNLKNQLINPIYGKLMSNLNLPEDLKEEVTDILLEKYMSALDSLSNKGDDETKLSPSEVQENINEKLKELLSEDEFEEFAYYQKTEQERILLSQLNNNLMHSNQLLSDDQREGMVEIMLEEKEAKKDDPNYLDETNIKDKTIDDEFIDNFIALQNEINQKVQKRAADVLTPEQNKIFQEFQHNMLKQMSLGLQMQKKK